MDRKKLLFVTVIVSPVIHDDIFHKALIRDYKRRKKLLKKDIPK